MEGEAGLSHIEVSQAFEVILFQLGDAVVLQVQEFGVRGDVLRHLCETCRPITHTHTVSSGI